MHAPSEESELLCRADASDAEIVEAVVGHYVASLRRSQEALGYLARRGLDDEALIANARIGYSDRSLGNRLPERNRKAGAALRAALIRLGVYRASGHEHFRGCVVVPILGAAGEIQGLFARRLDGEGPDLWASGMEGGIFNEAGLAGSPLVVVADVLDALLVMGAGHRHVVAPGREGGFSRKELSR